MGDKLRLLCNKRPLYDFHFALDAPCLANSPPPAPFMTVNAKNKELAKRREIIQFILFLRSKTREQFLRILQPLVAILDSTDSSSFRSMHLVYGL